jgi:hypothetical protein
MEAPNSLMILFEKRKSADQKKIDLEPLPFIAGL